MEGGRVATVTSGTPKRKKPPSRDGGKGKALLTGRAGSFSTPRARVALPRAMATALFLPYVSSRPSLALCPLLLFPFSSGCRPRFPFNSPNFNRLLAFRAPSFSSLPPPPLPLPNSLPVSAITGPLRPTSLVGTLNFLLRFLGLLAPEKCPQQSKQLQALVTLTASLVKAGREGEKEAGGGTAGGDSEMSKGNGAT